MPPATAACCLQTRGILTWVNQAAPGAFHPEVRYATVAGRLIQGAPLLGPGSWQQRVVGAGYQQVGWVAGLVLQACGCTGHCPLCWECMQWEGHTICMLASALG